MNILIPIFSPPTGTWGSLTRVMALTKKFNHEGHKVVFCASGYVKKTLEDKGYTVYQIPETTLFGLSKFISDIITKKSQKMAPPAKEGRSFGSIWLLYTFLGYSKRKVLKKIVKAEIRAAKDLNIDMILTEMELGAYLTAYILGIPIVSTYNNVAKTGENTFFYKKLSKTIKYILSEYEGNEKVNINEIIYGTNVLKIIPSIPELDGTNPERKDVCYTGNLLEPVKNNDEIFYPEEGKKYIFCYFGSGSISLKKVIEVLPIVINEYKDIICFVASQSIDRDYSIGNVHFVKYIQASELLPYCLLTICHGGLNTITQSLEVNVPLLVFPGAIFERRFNAERVESTGGGFMGEISDFNVEWIKDKMKRIEELQVEKLQKQFLKYNGVQTAYDYITRWINNEV